MSAVKLGLAVAWPAFWTTVPFKAVIALLFLAMGLHPWEGTGLAFLLLLSIPVDIWAIGLAARTVFLERLRIEPPAGIGLTLFWQAALVSAFYLPFGYYVLSGATAVGKAVTHKVLGLLEDLPVAEMISLELVMWSSVSTVVLILLIIGWLFLVGLLVRIQATAGRSSGDTYQSLIRRWDLLRIPQDQTLFFAVLTAAGVLLIVAFWGFMPVTTPHPHEDYEMPVVKDEKIIPAKALKKVEGQIAQAEFTLEELEKKGKLSKGKSKKGKPKASKAAKPVQQASDAPAHQHDETDGAGHSH